MQETELALVWREAEKTERGAERSGAWILHARRLRPAFLCGLTPGIRPRQQTR